jgi:hypothetical protein
MNTLEQSEAIRTVERTMEALNNKGWCVWTCSNLDNERIFVVQSQFSILHLPHNNYPVYTVDELKELSEASIESIKLIHAAKKIVPGMQVVKDE